MTHLNNPTDGAVIALDIGNARIGVAASDSLRITASPLTTLQRGGGRELQEIVDIIKNRTISEVVIGIPFELDGTVGDQANVSLSFKKQLEKRLIKEGLSDIKLKDWDERFTSVEAQRVLAGSKLKNKDRRAATDRIAAAIILESYLISQKV